MTCGKLMLVAAILVTSFIAKPQIVTADDRLLLYYLHLPGLLGPDGKSGPVGKILAEISARSGIRFQLRRTILNRMVRELQKNVPAAGVPQLGAMIPVRFEKDIRLSPPIVFRFDYAFVRTGTRIPNNVEEMKKMVLVVSPMTTLPPPLRGLADLTVLKTHSDASALTLLSTGRADLWVNDETTTQTAQNASGVTNIKHDPNKPFHIWPAHMVYSPVLDGTLIDRIDKAINAMAADGTLKKLLPRNYAENYSPG